MVAEEVEPLRCDVLRVVAEVTTINPQERIRAEGIHAGGIAGPVELNDTEHDSQWKAESKTKQIEPKRE